MTSFLSPRKEAIRRLYDGLAATRDRWIHKNAYYYEEDRRYMRFLVPPALRVLELGCGTGDLLAAVEPAHGVGVDVSAEMVRHARAKHPHLRFQVGDIEDGRTIGSLTGPFDVIILSDTIGVLEDCEAMLASLQPLCTRDTRVIVSYFSRMWAPVLKLVEAAGLKMPQPEQNWLATEDIESLLRLADFDIVKREWRILFPRRLFGIGRFVNRYIGHLPVLRRLCLRNYVVAKPQWNVALADPSVSVIVPCRNERGNIEEIVRRMPRFGRQQEIIFVEGHSRDGTFEEIQRVVQAHPEWDMKVFRQDGAGKGDAVRKGFEQARGEVLMILDADMTVAPESLPKFYAALVSGKGNFINGSRLVYPMEEQAMRFLNLVANHLFSAVFSWLLNQRITDTLCGTKVLTRWHYQRIAADRSYFGEFDPFGDFDLLFGAAKQNLKIVDVPVRYASRRYGETQISRFRHGWLLLRMVVFAFRKMKAL